jgi:glutamine synthetase
LHLMASLIAPDGLSKAADLPEPYPYHDPIPDCLLHQVLSKKECVARTTVMYNHYVGTVEMEAKCMVDMIKQHIIPSCKAADMAVHELEGGVASVQAGLHAIHTAADEEAKAKAARVLRLETMMDVRKLCDKAEEDVPADLWTIATYKDLLFLDATNGAEIVDYE